VITEVLFNPAQAGIDKDHEWIEIYNDGDVSVQLLGWSLADDDGADFLPAHTLDPGAYVIVASSAAFHSEYPDYDGSVLVIADGDIGDGLSNTGDRLILRDPSGQVIDRLSYGADRSVLDPAAPLAAGGSSIERSVAKATSAFVMNESPSPGVPYEIRIIVSRPPESTTLEDSETAPGGIRLDDVATAALVVGFTLAFAVQRSRIRR
jgi:hypothetical protein